MTRNIPIKGFAWHRNLGKVQLLTKQVVNFSGEDEVVGYGIRILEKTKTLSGNVLMPGHKMLTTPRLLYLDGKATRRIAKDYLNRRKSL